MNLITDTNVIVGELFRTRGRFLLTHTLFTWFATEEIASEVHHEVRRRLVALAAQGKMFSGVAARSETETLNLFDSIVQIVPQATYAPLLPLAAQHIADPDDQPTVALALAVDAGIWTLAMSPHRSNNAPTPPRHR